MVCFSYSENTVAKDVRIASLTFSLGGHPRVLKYLVNRQSLGGVLFENALEQTERLGRHSVSTLFVIRFALDDLFVEFAHVAGLEGHCAKQHCVEDHARRPNVRLVARVAFVFKHFRRDIRRSATLLKHQFLRLADEFADTEVADLDVALTREEHVVQLDVSVEHSLTVDVAQTLENLPEEVSSYVLFELSPSSHVG